MTAEKPIIAAIRGEAETIVIESGAGRVVPPERPDSMAEASIELSRMPVKARNEMGQMGLEYYRSRMAMEVGIDAIEKIFIDCVDKKRKPATN